VLDYLMNAFPVHQMTTIEDADGNETLVPVTDEEGRAVLSQDALALREDLVTRLALLPSVMGVLDSLVEAFGSTAIAEITGRTRRVVTHDGRRIVERRGASAAKAETDAFMSGRKRILVFSDAGGTGRSYHADLAAKNQDKRRHFLAEPGWRADVAIQGLGRTHRTNQASAPIFCPVTTNIQGERRFLSTIARRLDSLGALTRGERRASSNGLFRAEDNLESSWAHSALTHFYALLAGGSVPDWTVEAFEDKTALAILDGDRVLLPNDRLPPMHTFLNRLLALRIDDQNSLFETFAKLLAAIVERAEQQGLLDHGLEDIVADDLTVLSEEVLRTDLGTGATTRLVRFAIRTPRAIRTADEALVAIAPFDPAAAAFVVNAKSGRAAIAIAGHTTTDDNHDLIQAVRLLRPTEMTVAPAAAYGESSWEAVDPAVWRATWDAEVLGLDPFHTRELNLITGVLLPVWKFMPQKRARVRRIKAPDGRQWLGRSLQDGELATLKAALGLTDIATEMAASGVTEKLVLEQNAQVALTGGLWLRRVRIMDRQRIEVVGGATVRSDLVALGGQIEIINYTPRFFCQVAAGVVDRLIAKYPVTKVLNA
jgi:hypothetical protein